MGKAAGRAAKGLFAPVEKWLRRRIAKSRRHHHVFRGEVRRGAGGTWKAQGWHHRFGGLDQPDRRVTQVTRRDVNGAYHAWVEMKGPGGQWVTKRGGSSFFPDNWTPQEVDLAIERAFAASTPVADSEGHRWQGFYDGMLIEGSYHHNGKAWDSGWPVIPRPERSRHS